VVPADCQERTGPSRERAERSADEHQSAANAGRRRRAPLANAPPGHCRADKGQAVGCRAGHAQREPPKRQQEAERPTLVHHDGQLPAPHSARPREA
jgi:hypothetical protein